MRVSVGRRGFMIRAGASLGTLAMARPLSAALIDGPGDLNRLLGTKVPRELLSLLPDEVFEGASFVRKLMLLEAEAKTLRLPPSLLSRGDGALPLDPDRLYELALPRLVALIDRSELRNLPFAERSGDLLGLLHRSQHVVPEGWGEAAVPARPLFLADPAALPGRLTLDLPAPAASPEAEATPTTPPEISHSIQFDALADEYAALFKTAQIRPEHRESADWHLTMLRQSKERYSRVGERSGVPWYFIGIVHGLEASFNFRAHLHNGDYPLNQRTRQVPAGRPLRWLPPSDWESSAADALRIMGFAHAEDWSLPRILYRIEAFNGFGYRRMGRATPYLWSFTTLYDRGKYVADGKFNPQARSQQCGAAAVLKLLAEAGEIAFS